MRTADRTGRVLALAACVAVGGSVLLAGCAPIETPPAPRNDTGLVLAEVGDRIITDRELERRILERYYGPRALLGLVREALFLEEARRMGLEVERDELDARVEDELAAVLGTTDAERRESLERLRWQGLRLEDVRAELEHELQGLLLIQKVVAAHRDVSEEQLREVYERTWNADRRRVRHITFPLRGDPSDEEAVAMTLNRANSVRNAILSGASFAESARTLSGNPETAGRGGDIGWLSREEFGDDELAEFVFALEVGQLSPVYREGEYGFHLFQVTDERAARPFEEVQEELRRDVLAAPPTDEEIIAIESGLRRRTPVRIRPEILAPVGDGPNRGGP